MPFSVVQLSCIGTQIRNPDKTDQKYGFYHDWRMRLPSCGKYTTFNVDV